LREKKNVEGYWFAASVFCLTLVLCAFFVLLLLLLLLFLWLSLCFGVSGEFLEGRTIKSETKTN